MDALLIKKNASILQSIVTIKILALSILAMQFLDVNMLLWVWIKSMTTMHVPLILALSKMVLHTNLLFVIMETNAQLDLAIPLKDANTPTKFVMITMLAPLILALTEIVSTLLLFALAKHA